MAAAYIAHPNRAHETLLPLVDTIVLYVGDRRARVPLGADPLIHRVRRRSIGAVESCIAFVRGVLVTSSVILREKSDPTKIHPQKKALLIFCIDSRSCCLGYGRDQNKFARRFHLAIATFLL